MENSTKNLNELGQRIAKDNTADAKNLINELFVDLAPEAVRKARMPESAYNANFKAYFTGKEDISKNPTIIAKWTEYAGGPHNEVEIFDDETNKTLFITPKLLAEVDSDSLDMDINKDMIEVDLYRNQSTMLSNKKLNSLCTSIGNKVEVKKSEETWEGTAAYDVEDSDDTVPETDGKDANIVLDYD